MPSGREIAKENLDKFRKWVVERRAANDWADYIHGIKLNRTEIANECVFAASALRQNPAIKKELNDLEGELRDTGILAESLERNVSDAAAKIRKDRSSSLDRERIKQLEERNAGLQAEVNALKGSLKKFELFDRHLAETGRAIKP